MTIIMEKTIMAGLFISAAKRLPSSPSSSFVTASTFFLGKVSGTKSQTKITEIIVVAASPINKSFKKLLYKNEDFLIGRTS